MNRYTLLLTFLLSLGSYPSLGIDFKDLVERNGFYYEKFSDLPYTGEVTGEEQGSLRKGLKEGEWVEYYYNGQLESQENFKNGLRNGKSVWYHNNGHLWWKDFITTTKSKVNRSIITIMDSCKKEELTRMEREG